uniref:Uncharacterized protein n=1 Tax=Anguilla anguilla TaxID=7936 RepID=A0A0E9PHV6_ANGAN
MREILGRVILQMFIFMLRLLSVLSHPVLWPQKTKTTLFTT